MHSAYRTVNQNRQGGTARRWGSALFTSHIHFSDHTDEEARTQLYFVVTSDSIVRFFTRIDPGMVATELSLKSGSVR